MKTKFLFLISIVLFAGCTTTPSSQSVSESTATKSSEKREPSSDPYKRRFRCIDIVAGERPGATDVYLINDALVTRNSRLGAQYVIPKDGGRTMIGNDPAQSYVAADGNTITLKDSMINGPHGGGAAEFVDQGMKWSASCLEED
jgi:hypothetical protein